jgi:cation transport regulator ChaC
MADSRQSTALFAYGSLVNPESAAMTLGRSPIEVSAASLPGWRRRFSSRRDNLNSEKTFARSDGSLPEWILSLNIEPAPGSAQGPNGVLIAVGDEDLIRLDRRELRYERADVTADVEFEPGAEAPEFDRVLAYVARPENLAREAPSGSVVLKSYVEAVESAFDHLGPGALTRYRASTEPPAVEIVEATLAEGRIPRGNPRAW